MRSAIILAALAVGTCAKVIEKEVYVTDWTTVTVTETVTQWPTATGTAVVVKQHHTKPAEAALPIDVSKKAAKIDSAPAAASTTAAAVVEEAAPSSTSSTTSSSTTQAELKAVTTSATSAATTTAAAAATTSASSTTAAAATTAPSAGNSYQESVLHYHNIHRSDHSSPALTWSTDLEKAANTLASRCEYGHDTSIESASGSYGQNIAYGYDKADVGEKIISDMMYTREAPNFASLYGQANPDMSNFEVWGHFTQIVWKATTEVGCATVTCADLKNIGGEGAYTVCNYGSPGNVGGGYAENVLKPSS
ncbi:hypothetical protein N7517_008651 [Penicillium concentricum]|uniref:SCP domain-containing protein n=1 Tax=Penicillium concentricum TaxID=293559 RepID=A0A9W9RSU2_9EURO|nr:uncharacterized protein N7517_008651 [Penicillium concentricum]KAJ5365765.1 hypothetical protein N7517_008651 [Penicillium concentricum]